MTNLPPSKRTSKRAPAPARARKPAPAAPQLPNRVDTEEAHRQRVEAKLVRLRAADADCWTAAVDQHHAEALERTASATLTPPEPVVVGTGGEFVPQGRAWIEKPGIVDLVRDPEWTHLHASEDRLGLAAEAQCFDLAAATADAIGARDDTERMLAHQLAAAHVAGMRCLEAMYKAQGRAERHDSLGAHTKLLGEAARMGQLAVRFMDTYQRGLQTLGRLRTGNRQTVTVVHQHVTVEGGQVAVAGAVQPRGGRGQDAIKATTSYTHLNQPPSSASSAALRGEPEEGRPALPSPGDAEWAMPDARGAVAGRADGKAERQLSARPPDESGDRGASRAVAVAPAALPLD
jgi:hypothetical protein